MSTTQKPREFWIYDQKDPANRYPYPTTYRSTPQWGCEPLPVDDPFAEVIHVIEYSAVEKLAAENAELKARLEKAEGAENE